MDNITKKSIYEKNEQTIQKSSRDRNRLGDNKEKAKTWEKNKGKSLEYSRNCDRNLSEKEKEVKGKCGRDPYLKLFKN